MCVPVSCRGRLCIPTHAHAHAHAQGERLRSQAARVGPCLAKEKEGMSEWEAVPENSCVCIRSLVPLSRSHLQSRRRQGKIEEVAFARRAASQWSWGHLNGGLRQTPGFTQPWTNKGITFTSVRILRNGQTWRICTFQRLNKLGKYFHVNGLNLNHTFLNYSFELLRASFSFVSSWNLSYNGVTLWKAIATHLYQVSFMFPLYTHLISEANVSQTREELIIIWRNDCG